MGRLIWSGAALIVLMAAAIGFGTLVRSLDPPAQTRTAYKVPYFSRSEAESQLNSIESSEATDPSGAVQRYLALLDRVRVDESLGDLADRIRVRLQQTRLHSAEADLSAARAALAAEPNRALALCERATRTAEDLPPGSGIQLRDEARKIATQLTDRVGVILAPVDGHFRLGSTKTYNDALHPRLAEALRQRGFVPVSESSPFHALWDERAPYRLTVEVLEDQNDFYEQSKNRISRIDAKFTLSRAGTVLWQAYLNARTQVPLPKLRVYEAHRLATANEHNPAFERRFHDDALNTLLVRLALKLRDLPAPAQ